MSLTPLSATMTSTTDSELTLFVYLVGLGNPFAVDIERSKTVGHLKQAILLQKPNGLKGIDAARLVLYKVELPDSEDLLVSQASGEKLESQTMALSEIFPMEPPEEVISILVEVPVISE
jgi:hypothetical protein